VVQKKCSALRNLPISKNYIVSIYWCFTSSLKSFKSERREILLDGRRNKKFERKFDMLVLHPKGNHNGRKLSNGAVVIRLILET